MQFNQPYLKDSAFLRMVDEMHNKTQQVKITVLTFDEEPIKDIQGYATSGSINIDGSSSMRRTGSLSIIADEATYSIMEVDNLISLNKKVCIQIGIKNTTNQYKDYDWLWFPQGIFIMVGASISHDASGININLSLKDKMCLLNGDVGGVIPAAVSLNEIISTAEMKIKSTIQSKILINSDTTVTSLSDIQNLEDKQTKTLVREGIATDASDDSSITNPTIYQIVQEVVNHFGGEALSRIVITDVDNRAKRLMKWIGSTPLYKYCFDNSQNKKPRTYHYSISLKYGEKKIKNWSSLVAANLAWMETYYYGDNIGYVYTDFTYPGELVASPGDTVCSILDKIVNTIGNYEYFYDVEGNFRFQEIKNYLNTTQAKTILDELQENNGQIRKKSFDVKTKGSSYIIDLTAGKTVYDFNDATIVTSYNVSPQWENIKNDFIIWGTRKNAAGLELPVRYHLAIDTKPEVGQYHYCVQYTDDPNYDTGDTETEKAESRKNAIMKYAVPLEYTYKSDLPTVGVNGVFYKCLYDGSTPIDKKIFYLYSESKEEYYEVSLNPILVCTKNWQTELYFQGQEASPYGTASNYYFSELVGEWPKLFEIVSTNKTYEGDSNDPRNGNLIYEDKLRDNLNGMDLDYFLDIIDSSAEAGVFNVDNIGRRSYIKQESSVNCLFPPDYPDVILINNNSLNKLKEIDECDANGQSYSLMDGNLYSSLATGDTYVSAYNTVKNLLYQYTSYNESVNLTTLPVFYLEPNTRISISDSGTGINGDYIIKSISVPFEPEGTMNISCTKVLQNI